MYVITGATGNTGKIVAEALLKAGAKVRVVGREASRLEPLAKLGAEPFVADLGDADSLTRAFHGANAVYAMIPPNYATDDFRAYQNRVGDALTRALVAANVGNVVQLSSVGAELPQGTGPIGGLHDLEQKLGQALKGANVLYLRPAYFMENLFTLVPVVQHMGFVGSPAAVDVPIAMIATRDIGGYAAKRLLALDFSGHGVQYLLGPADVTFGTITEKLGRLLSKPDLKYVQFSYADADAGMRQMGLTANLAGLFVEMNRGFNEGLIKPTEPRSAKNSTPTPVDAILPYVAAAIEKK